MKAIYQIFVSVVVCGCLLCSLLFGQAEAQPMVEIEIDPHLPQNIISLGVEPEELIITTRTNTQNLQFVWSLNGPGEFAGDTTGPGILYLPPEQIEGESAQVMITVAVTDESGAKATNSVTFTIQKPVLPTPTPTPVPTPTPLPTPTPVPTPTPLPTPTPVPLRILQVLLKDAQETILNPTYEIKPGDTITLAVEISRPEGNVKIECSAIRGKIIADQQKITYTAPNKAGVKDMITVKIVDPGTGKTIVQQIIKMTIVDTTTSE